MVGQFVIFIIKFAPIHKGGCRDYMKLKAYHSGVCEHRGFISKNPICSSSERDSVYRNAQTIFFCISSGHFKLVINEHGVHQRIYIRGMVTHGLTKYRFYT